MQLRHLEGDGFAIGTEGRLGHLKRVAALPIGFGDFVIARAVAAGAAVVAHLGGVTAWIRGGGFVERFTESELHALFTGGVFHRHMQRFAGVAEAVKASGPMLVARPTKEAAGVKLAINRMEAAAHHAGRCFAEGNATHATLRHAVNFLVGHGEEPAGAVTEVDEGALERAPFVAGHPQLLGRRAVDAVVDPHHGRIVILRVAPGHVRAHVAIEAVLLDEVDTVLRNPVAFLIAGKIGAVAVHRHAVGRAKTVGDTPALGAVLAHLDDRAVMRHQAVLRVARALGIIEIARVIRLQIHRKLMKMFGHLMVVVEIFVKINLAIVVGIVQARDLVTAANINRLVHNLQAQRLEHAGGNAAPCEFALGQVEALDNPHIALPRAHGGTAVVFEEIKPAETHP